MRSISWQLSQNSRYKAKTVKKEDGKLPIAQILIPNNFREFENQASARVFNYSWENMDAGLDGVEIKLPALPVSPFQNGLVPVNVQIKDPLSPIRNMFDFSFSVKPNESRVIWCDLRDKILPIGKPLYITIACGSPRF